MKMIPLNFERYLFNINKNMIKEIKKTYYDKKQDMLSFAMIEGKKKQIQQKPNYSKRYSRKLFEINRYSLQNMKKLCEYYDNCTNQDISGSYNFNNSSYNSYSSYGSYNSYSSYGSYNSYSSYGSYSSYQGLYMSYSSSVFPKSSYASYNMGSFVQKYMKEKYSYSKCKTNEEDYSYLTKHLGFDKEQISNRNYKNEYKYEQCNIQQNFFVLGYGLELI